MFGLANASNLAGAYRNAVLANAQARAEQERRRVQTDVAQQATRITSTVQIAVTALVIVGAAAVLWWMIK